MKLIVAKWMVHLGDPAGGATAPREALSSAELGEVLIHARRHGVLAIVLRNLQFVSNDPNHFAFREAMVAYRNETAVSAMLRLEAAELTEAIAHAALPGAMIKGPIFARSLYPDKSLRRYTDIDLLIAPNASDAFEALLRARNFELVDADPTHCEWKWQHRNNPGLQIEIQTNVIHAASLRKTLSLTYSELTFDGGPAEAYRPSALLAVAVAHGVVSDQFKRLQQVVDLCQAARGLSGSSEEARFEQLVTRSGMRFAAVIGLNFAARLFAEPRCREIARAIGPFRAASLGRALLTRSAVAYDMGAKYPLSRWRRVGVRLLLRQRWDERRTQSMRTVSPDSGLGNVEVKSDKRP